MDIEQFMDAGSNQFEYDESQELKLPIELYDQESELHCPIFEITIDEAVEILSKKESLVDIPIPELIHEVVNEYNFNHAQVKELAKRMKKIKNILKRRRAKCRVFSDEYNSPIAQVEKKLFSFEESSTDKDTLSVEKEIKKQRNRISAQVSRDKKKYYVNGLEQKNKELAEESENLKEENDKLRQEILEIKKGPYNHKANKNENKLKKFFILLGILFFISILQDIFNFQAKATSLVSEKEIEQESKSTGLESIESKKILDQIKEELEQMGCEELNFELSISQGMKFKKIIFKKIEEIKKKVKTLMLPGRLASNLLSLKSTFLF